MRFKYFFFIQSLILTYSILNKSKVEAGKGKLLWSDEFDSWQTLNDNWIAEIGGHGWGNNELQYYTNLNHRLENGILIIEARRESYGGMRFTSTRLISKSSFKYGVFEMRARLPRGLGTWPAFWLLSDKRPLSSPDDGEIDVMEHVGYNPNQIHGSIHCKKYNHIFQTEKTAWTKINNAFDDYHTYTLDWSSNRIEVHVDGFKYFVYQKEDNSYDSWPFDNGFNIILNLAIGGNWGGAMGLDETIFPAQYHIDYVRQYEHIDDPVSIVVSVNKISLKAKANGKYVCADNYGLEPLIANKDGVLEWETFEMTKYSDGYVILKSFSNQKYVCAENYGNDALIANRNTVDNWEKFELISNNDGTVSFRAKNNWKFVSADNYGKSPLIANRVAIDDWEKFYLNYV